jgi:hypothetical protein
MPMWLPKPWYEALPYLHGVAGLAVMAASWFTTGARSRFLLMVGAVWLLVSLVLWLRRKDSRAQRRRYDSHSLDGDV